MVQWGPNKIINPDAVSAVRIVLAQIKGNLIVYLLILAALISFLIRENVTGVTVTGVIFLVVGMGFFQEYRAENAVARLREMTAASSTVVRDGQEQSVPTTAVVPGDTVILRAGEKIPADGKITQLSQLAVDEAVLTGESEPITKKVGEMVFAGTYILAGRATATIQHTGMSTKFGQIVKLVARTEKELPLAGKVNNIARVMVVIAIIISALTGFLLIVRAPVVTMETLVHILVVVIALMVSAFPEGMPVVLATSLAMGASRMAKKNAIVNRMSIIETLGETTVICADKTGTITTGQMTVEKVFSKNLEKLWQAAVLCNDTPAGGNGRGTEAALLAAAAKEKVFREDLNFTREEEIPFSSEKKMMAVFGKMGGKNYSFIKGAPEVVLARCKNFNKTEIEKINQEWTGAAYRTIALAGRPSRGETNLTFFGLVGLADPPRPEVKEAIVEARAAGIAVKMITGDHRQTALAVAGQIGLTGEVLEGTKLDQMTDDELGRVVAQTAIFARVRPEHKLRIVKALRSLGEVVTMTGDGVNDSPALKEAHIGVAMGIGGTDVARSVADLTLKDNNFATIVTAIREGRTIFNNMRKFVTYQLSCNLAELAILFFGVLLAPLFGWQTPVLLALQILFLNLVTDDLPAITFAFNRSSQDVMDEPPRKKPEILTNRLILVAFLAGGLMTVLTLLVFGLAGRTEALLALIILEVANAFNFRSLRQQSLTRSPLTNGYLFGAAGLSLVLSLAIIYLPINTVFETTPLGGREWLMALAAAFVFILIFDFLKFLNARFRFLDFS